MGITIDPQLPAYEPSYTATLFLYLLVGICVAWFVYDLARYWLTKKNRKDFDFNPIHDSFENSKNKSIAILKYIGWLFIKVWFSWVFIGGTLLIILVFTVDEHHLNDRNDQAKEYLETTIVQKYNIQPTDGSLDSILDRLYTNGDLAPTPDAPQTLGNFTALDTQKQVMTITVIREKDTIMLYSDGTRLTPITPKD